MSPLAHYLDPSSNLGGSTKKLIKLLPKRKKGSIFIKQSRSNETKIKQKKIT